MNWQDKKKFTKIVSRMAALGLLLFTTYQLYNYYKARNLQDYQMQNSYTGLKTADTAKRSENRSFTIRQPEDKQEPRQDSQSAVTIHTDSSFHQTTSLTLQNSVLPKSGKPATDTAKSIKTAGALQGPSALFSREYKIGIGQTVPVNILWESSGEKAMNYKLITIKVDDIANNKARFTIEDPFNVLLFSQTGYGVNDKIIIEDERYNLNISVLQVTGNSVAVKVVSRLNESIVSKLQKAM